MKLKPVVLLLAVLPLWGCAAPEQASVTSSGPVDPSALDGGARAACDSLLFDITDAGGAEALVGVDAQRWGVMVRQYRHELGDSGTALIRDSAEVLTNVTSDGSGARALALDTAAGRCLDAGWAPN